MRIPVLILIAIFCGLPAEAQIVPDWRDQTHTPFPLAQATIAEPVLTGHDVTDFAAWYVADPFLMHEADGPWHMFLEVYEWRDLLGHIGHATSPDGIHWTYDRIVLDAPYNLSFPYVFKYNGDYYMIVHNSEIQEVDLYKAADYPYDWTHAATLLTGLAFADPAIIRYKGLWYMFVSRSSGAECWLYWSYRLTEGWVEHPRSPIVYDYGKARPAGRPLLYGGRLIRLAQKNDDHYGEAVRAFEVDTLTQVLYEEHEIPESPILRASGQGWNSYGMHTCDAWWNVDHWIAAVDGVDETAWSIGIYRTATASGLDERRAWFPSPGIDVAQNSPNPFSVATEILVRLSDTREREQSPPLEIYDSAGRLVRSLMIGDVGAGVARVSWDGTDALGRAVAAGVYYYKLESQNRPAERRMILLR